MVNKLPPSQMALKGENKSDDSLSLRDKKLELILQQGFSLDNLEMKTDLNMEQILAITRAKMFADLTGVSLVDDVVDTLMTLSVSKGRLGRKEWFDMGKSFANDEPEPNALKKMFGVE